MQDFTIGPKEREILYSLIMSEKRWDIIDRFMLEGKQVFDHIGFLHNFSCKQHGYTALVTIDGKTILVTLAVALTIVLVQLCKAEALKLTTNEDEVLLALAKRHLPVSLENMTAVENEAFQVLNKMSSLN